MDEQDQVWRAWPLRRLKAEEINTASVCSCDHVSLALVSRVSAPWTIITSLITGQLTGYTPEIISSQMIQRYRGKALCTRLMLSFYQEKANAVKYLENTPNQHFL